MGPAQCTVQWAAHPGATSYVVAELFNVTFANGKPVNGSWEVLGTVGANVLSLNVTGLQPATSYLLDVYAGDAAGGSWVLLQRSLRLKSSRHSGKPPTSALRSSLYSGLLFRVRPAMR